MKEHTLIDASMLDKLEHYKDEKMIKIAYQICRWHHERYDGRGYPDGLKGDEIPEESKIIAVADSFDAMTGERCYRKPVSAHDALSDVIVLKNLFEKLSTEHSLPKMIIACEAPIILEYIPYGKHKGKRFVDVAKEARGDLHYMLKSESLDQDVKASIEHALDTTKETAVLTITFGKYAGKTPQEILEIDRNYLFWLHTKAENLHEELKEQIGKLLVSIP